MTQYADPEVLPEDAIIPADGRLITIDILRGLAILWVVLYHIWGVSAAGFDFIPSPRVYEQRFWERLTAGELLPAATAFTDLFFRVGNNGVTVFMILSGVSLTMSAMRSRRPLSARSFYPTRLRRVLIPYWVAWALYIATLAGVGWYETRMNGGAFMHNFQYLATAKVMEWDFARAGLLLVPRGLRAQYLFAPAPTMWFVLLLVQYYLLFPLLMPLLRRVKPVAFASLCLSVSVGSSAWLIWAYGSIGARGHWWSAWFPFRFFEFGIGMAIGYAMVAYPATLRRTFPGAPAFVALIALGVGLHTWGGWLDDGSGYWNSFGYQLVTAGFALLVLALIVARPGAILTSRPLRLMAFVGTISYPVLIVNGSFFFINDYLIIHGYQWSFAWWYYIVVLYVPLTIVLAYPLAAVLGLLPKPPRAAAPAPAVAVELQRA